MVKSTALVPKFSDEEVQLVKDTVARGCTDTEFKLLLYEARQLGLNPLTKQIWAVKFGDAPALIFVGRDGYLQIAHRSGNFDGMESGVREENGKLIGWAEVHRKDMAHPFRVEVAEEEYNRKKGNWLTMPRTMIQKVAESQALRRAFSISGVYSPEEIDEEVPKERPIKDITPVEDKEEHIPHQKQTPNGGEPYAPKRNADGTVVF